MHCVAIVNSLLFTDSTYSITADTPGVVKLMCAELVFDRCVNCGGRIHKSWVVLQSDIDLVTKICAIMNSSPMYGLIVLP